jgi:hypothetical protein
MFMTPHDNRCPICLMLRRYRAWCAFDAVLAEIGSPA